MAKNWNRNMDYSSGSPTDAPLGSMSSTDSESGTEEVKTKKVIIWKDRSQRVQLLKVDYEHESSLAMDYLDDKDPDLVYAKFLHAYRCYDLIPTSSKLVVFDTQLSVKKAFFALIYNGVRAAPLWDSHLQKFVGILTITDFIKILQQYYNANGCDMRELEEHRISTWREVLHEYSLPLIYIEPEATLFEAIQLLCKHRVHRLPVIDMGFGNPLYILTHKRILRFLFLYIYQLPEPDFMKRSLEELNLGTYRNVISAQLSTPLIKAFYFFIDHRISALPIVDDDYKVVELFAKFDVIHLAADKSYKDLHNMTVDDALRKRKKVDNKVGTCLKTATLKSVMEQIVRTEYHRLAVIDKDNKLVGIISLSDILHFLILKPSVSTS